MSNIQRPRPAPPQIPFPPPTGWVTELRATFALAWPLVIAQLAQNALTTTDVIMLGWLGPRYLAAGTLATTFLMPFLLCGIGIVGAVAPLVAQARGARDIKAGAPHRPPGLLGGHRASPR